MSSYINEEENKMGYPSFKVLDDCPRHEWLVFSTALQDVCLILVCAHCGKAAIVEDPTKAEWSRAYHAPSNPYPWDGDLSRVKMLPDEQQPKVWKAPMSDMPTGGDDSIDGSEEKNECS